MAKTGKFIGKMPLNFKALKAFLEVATSASNSLKFISNFKNSILLTLKFTTLSSAVFVFETR